MTVFSTEILQLRVNYLCLIVCFFNTHTHKIKIPTDSDYCWLDLCLGKNKQINKKSGKQQHEQKFNYPSKYLIMLTDHRMLQGDLKKKKKKSRRLLLLLLSPACELAPHHLGQERTEPL